MAQKESVLIKAINRTNAYIARLQQRVAKLQARLDRKNAKPEEVVEAQ